ncbi:unnamed protein product [Nesidiocoris tenuis]|uniref:TAFH domain-containing protein n=1 Tax=Nesidiocoris tenuis TaxID=355587 RepID=A0A6H5G0P5_9HEMI|nr:unnamed protein product [Nesidiocoris tenuis]
MNSSPSVNPTIKQESGVKVVYPSVNRIHPGTVVLPNGTVANTTSCEVQTSSSLPSGFKTNAVQPADHSKPTGTALVIKSGTAVSNASAGQGVVTFTKPMAGGAAGGQQIVGGSPLQIVNVNPLRAGGAQLAGARGMSPRAVMINTQQMVGGRPVAPGQITLQALQGLAPGTQGHLLLKTENGQYQLLRVGPPAPGQQATAITAGNFRLQTVQTTVVQRPALDQTKEKCRKFLANLLELSSREPKAVEKSVRTLIQELVDTKVGPEQFCDRLEKLLNAAPQPCLIGFLKKSLPLLRQSMVNNELTIEGIKAPPASVVYQTAIATATTTAMTLVAAATTQTSQVSGSAGTGSVVATATASTVPPPSATPIVPPISHLSSIVPTSTSMPMRMATAATQVSTAVGTAVKSPSVTTIRSQGTTTIVRPAGTQIMRTPTGSTIALRPGQALTKAQFSTRPVLAATTQFNQTTKPSVFVTAAPKQTSAAVSASHILPTAKEAKEKKTAASASTAGGGGFMGDDDINDVAAMGGVNLAEESQRILGSTEFVGTQIRSCKDDIFLHSVPLMNKIAAIARKHGLDEPTSDVALLISHATQERLKDLVEKLAIIAEHRTDFNKADPRYEVTQDVRIQLKCLEEVDKAERKRHEEQERELLLRAAKSRTKPEDPEQAKLKAKAKEMQRAEMEELRQREANLTALLAIGPRKKPKMDESAGSPSSAGSSTIAPLMTLRPRVKRVCMRDLLTMMEQEKETARSLLLYKSYFK